VGFVEGGCAGSDSSKREPVPQAVSSAAAGATAGPSDVKVEVPATATSAQDGLRFTLRLTKTSFLTGEGGQARVTLRNESRDNVKIGKGEVIVELVLSDEQGGVLPGWPPATTYVMSHPPNMQMLSPGQEWTDILTFHIPPEEPTDGDIYNLGANTQAGGESLLEVGPIPLTVTPPSSPAQRLVADIEVDGSGWRVRVHDGEGRVPEIALWGELLATSARSERRRPLRPEKFLDGAWSGSWSFRKTDQSVAALVWVSGAGYVTALAEKFAPDTIMSDFIIRTRNR
jgi:hypothetical protein